MADLNKVKAAAAARNKKGGKNWKLQYYVWIGGSVGSIVVAMLMLLLSPEKGPFSTPVNDQGLIAHVNRNAKSWTASASSFFEGWTIGDVKLLDGVGVSQMGGMVPQCVVPETPVPDSFDAREKWPQCFTSPIYNMGNCSASWAISTASALSNRFCISDPSAYGELMLSPQHLLSCDTFNRGCNGGDVDSAWNFIEREGLVSEVCFPYQADGMVSCHSRCTTETGLKAASHCQLSGEDAIKREIFLNGPVVAPIFLVDDFLVYEGGIYQETPTSKQLTGSDNRRNRLIHAVKIVGWGNVKRTKYWIVENSWGEDWGDQGYAKIIRGGDPEKREGIMIETFGVAGTPASQKLDDADLDGDIDLEDVDLDEEGGEAAGADDDDDE